MNGNKVTIRQEKKTDYNAVFNLIKQAFADEEYSNHDEQFLVERLRKSPAFISALSLVAEINNRVVGHILLTKIIISNGNQKFNSLALAPVSLLSEFQKQGIGGQLIRAAHKKAKDLGHKSIILLGHEKYYPKFGYLPTAKFGIKLPLDVPPENSMAIELVENGLKGVTGTVEYPKEFNE